jgi:hypothetical protein
MRRSPISSSAPVASSGSATFLLWQLAYSELYFTEVLWPEFDALAFDAALASYQQRERRFGRTSEQLLTVRSAAVSPHDTRRIDA